MRNKLINEEHVEQCMAHNTKILITITIIFNPKIWYVFT